LPPYRVHLHRRIARELPQLKLWTICTHEGDDNRWIDQQPPAEINTISFRDKPGTTGAVASAAALYQKGGKIVRWLEENRVRAVVVFGYNDPGRLRIIGWCDRHGIPCFVFGDSNIKGDLLSGIRAVLKRLLVGWVVDTATGMFACGSLGAAFFRKYGANPRRIYYFPYEPDYAEIQKLPCDYVDEMMAKYCLAPGRRRIVFSGRLAEQKQPDLAIASFLAIAPQRPDWDLVMLGDGPLRQRLVQQVPPSLAQRVTWTGFVNDQAAVSAIYRASDVLLLPSKFEPWALVINEAAAAGLAIVASDVVGAAAELVRDGFNGRVFAPDAPAQLVDCLLGVTSAENIDAMKAASLRVLEDWRRVADPIDGLRKALADAAVLC
jgi:glycosyltransferase involved in cell wall biosynthesis